MPLAPRERRVLGVLVEKAKTTPEYYPMTVAAIVTGCNQKSNRDPVTNYDQDDVEETLHSLRKKGAVDPGRGERPGRAVEAHALRLAEGEQGRAGGHGRAAVARPADRGRPAGAGQPDGAAGGPAGLAGDPRGAGCRGAWCSTSRRRARSGACSWRTGSIPPRSSRGSARRSPAGTPATTRRRRGCRPRASSSPRRRPRRPGRPRSPPSAPRSTSCAESSGRSGRRGPRPEIRTRSLTG